MVSRMAIVLAAGKGTRMESDLPKVLCPVLGRAMIHYVLDTLAASGFDKIVVVIGYQADLVKRELADRDGIEFVLQQEQKGTGHAVQMARDAIERHRGTVLVVAGDSPMLQTDSVVQLLVKFENEKLACLLGTLHKDDPTGLGRIVRDACGSFDSIVEHKDATPTQRVITEVNMSTMIFDASALLSALAELSDNNAQGEYYLTDCPGILKRGGQAVEALAALKPCEALSINTPQDLAAVEAEMQRQRA